MTPRGRCAFIGERRATLRGAWLALWGLEGGWLIGGVDLEESEQVVEDVSGMTDEVLEDDHVHAIVAERLKSARQLLSEAGVVAIHR